MRVVFDMDGTLCNIEHRLPLIAKSDGKKPDWPAFYRACVDDKPNISIIRVCSRLIWSGAHIEIWSGRSDEVRAETERWLLLHAIGYAALRMRKAGDYRQDAIVKMEWLDALPKEEWPEIVFDDRQQMVDAWRSRGIVCCQVAPGAF